MYMYLQTHILFELIGDSVRVNDVVLCELFVLKLDIFARRFEHHYYSVYSRAVRRLLRAYCLLV